MTGRRRRRHVSIVGGLLIALSGPAHAGGQEVWEGASEHLRAPHSTHGQDAVDPVSPRGAFLRSLVIPGWGHAAVGSRGRGGAYFLLQSASVWMVFQSHSLRRTARDLRRMEESLVEARLRAQGVADPVELRQAVAADPRVEEREELVETRAQQIEDWTALSVFLVLLIGADAFVSAHLADFPEPLSLRVLPAGPSGGVEIGVSLPTAVFVRP